MIHSLLNLDTSIFLSTQSLIDPKYANIIHILGESIVIMSGAFMTILWLIGVKTKNNEYKKISLRIFTGIIGVFILYGIINLGMPKWRVGAMELSGATALIPHPTDNSFPSGHALFSAALLVGIWKYYPKILLILLFIILALVTTTARVIWGVHYPGDIMGGLFFGFIGASFLAKYITTSELFEKNVYPFFIKLAGLIKL
jgi:membrane-associated phospholipid phosphatase